MNNNELLNQMNQLGFPMMETSGDLDANQVLANVVNSGDVRLMEGFPVVLANAAREYGYDYDKVMGCLKKDAQARQRHKALVLLSLALYQHYHLSLPWTTKLKNRFSKDELGKLKEFASALSKGHTFELEGYRLDPRRLKNLFDHYFAQKTQNTRDLTEKYEELAIEYSLSQVFSPKQKELFMKKLKGEVFTKTEREYYSRTVKKKVAALANVDVHRLAQRLMEM